MLKKLKVALVLVAGLVLLPFAAVIAFVVSRLRGRQLVRSAIRTSIDGFQTATLTFEKPDQNQTVKLHGMIHVGQRGYYDEIGAEIAIDEEAGNRILYERVSPPTDEELEALSRDERTVYEALKGIGNQQKEMARLFGLKHQMVVMEPKDTWHNTDLTQLELIRLMVQGKLAAFVSKMFARMSDAATRRTIGGMLFDYAIHSHFLIAIPAMLLMLPKYRKFKYYILDYRNDVAFDGIKEALREHNHVNSIWGAAHLPGMATMLQNEGFALTNTEWHTAFTFRQQSFIELAKALYQRAVDYFREQFKEMDENDNSKQ